MLCLVLLIPFVFVGLIHLGIRFLTSPVSESELRELGLESKTYSVGPRTIHYIETVPSALPIVVFVHGSPGSWKDYQTYMVSTELRNQTHMISIDRPGFGKSGFGKHEPSIQQQAALMKPVLEKSTNKSGVILVGHSLGGPVAARMAMEFPDLVRGLILIAPSIDPSLEKLQWYNRLLDFSLIQFFLPTALIASNREILPLKQELIQMLPLWDRIRCSTTVIQGGQDELVSPNNANFAERVLKDINPQIIRLPEAGHLIIWEQPEVTINAILSMLN